MGVGTDCEKYKDCANAEIKCHLCHNFNCFKAGKNVGKGRHHERKVKQLRNTKAELRRGSGNVATAKGDLIDSTFLHEAKSGYSRINTKGHSTFTLKREWLLKITREALGEGRLGVLEIHFDGSPDLEIYSVISSGALFDLVSRVDELEKKIEELNVNSKT